LRPEGAVYLADAAALLVADFHLGKAHSFRRLGLPVPAGTTAQMLARLDAVLAATAATQLVFLGDFLHAAAAQASPALQAFAAWRAQHPALALTLVRGNHDDRAGDPPATLAMRVVDEPFTLAGLALCHHPQRLPGQAVLAGHRHPAAVLHGRAGDRLRLPCFEVAPDLLVLPAFGAFTGMHTVARQPGVQRWASDGQRLHLLDR